MTDKLLEKLEFCARSSQSLSDELALELLELGDEHIDALCRITEKLTLDKFSKKVSLCAIVNAKSAPCSEDCSFCAQSAHHNAQAIDSGDFLSAEKILSCRDKALEKGAARFSPVTTGYALAQRDIDSLCEIISSSRSDKKPLWCASLGCLSLSQLSQLKRAGLVRYHHNIESAVSFYSSICTTHSFDKRIETVKNAQKAGLEVCCGGIIGLGESLAQRVEMARTLFELNVDSIALNFLLPAENTPLSQSSTVDKQTIIKTIAMMRLVNPDKELRIAAGRSLLGADQHKIFSAGASGMMIGDYLTVHGQNSLSDAEILRKVGRVAE